MKDRLRLLIWIPRVLNIGMAGALVILALEHLNWMEVRSNRVWNFFVFFSPGLLMILLLMISWREPLAGGVLFTLLALIMLFIRSETSSFINPLVLPLLITGIFYWMSHRLTRSDG